MEKLSLLLLSLVLIATCGFSAQQTSRRHPIGSLDDLVFAKEYCFFLDQNYLARYGGSDFWMRFYHGESYYDHQLMDSGPGKSPIIIRSGKPGNYDYSVAEGCDDIVIADLESQSAQQDFKEWRGHLSLGDICEYLNAQIIIKWSITHLDELSLDNDAELEQAHATADAICSHYNKETYNAEFKKMQDAVDLLLQREPQSYTILEGKQDVANKGWDDGSYIITHPSAALFISFPSFAEKPVVSLVDNKVEYERLNADDNSDDGTHLQFPQSLGAAVIPHFDENDNNYY